MSRQPGAWRGHRPPPGRVNLLLHLVLFKGHGRQSQIDTEGKIVKDCLHADRWDDEVSLIPPQ